MVHLLKEEFNLLLDDGGVDYLDKLAELVEVELMIRFIAHTVEKFVKIDVFGVDLESQLGHHHFEFVFEMLVLLSILLEVSFEDRVHKDFIPTQSLLLSQLQTSRDEIFCLGLEVVVDFQRFGLNIFNELELRMGSPGGTIMYHFI